MVSGFFDQFCNLFGRAHIRTQDQIEFLMFELDESRPEDILTGVAASVRDDKECGQGVFVHATHLPHWWVRSFTDSI